MSYSSDESRNCSYIKLLRFLSFKIKGIVKFTTAATGLSSLIVMPDVPGTSSMYSEPSFANVSKF